MTKSLFNRWQALAESPGGRSTLKVARALFATGIVALLVYQVTRIGWAQVIGSLPTHPLFYVLVLAMYLLLPVTESVIYGRLWRMRPLECIPIMIRKRVLNTDVVGYSGELYLFAWAKERVAAGGRAIMGTIKDNLIVSSAASLSAAALLIGGFLATGYVDLGDLVDQPSPGYIALGVIAATLAGLAVYHFRKVLFSLPERVLPLLAAAHLSRFLLGYVFQIAAWWIVVPTASFETWALLLVVFVLINRIPFLPSSDLVFASAGAGLAPMLDVPVAIVMGMLLVRSAFDRLLNLVLFTSTVWYERHRVSTRNDGNDLEGPQDVPVEAGNLEELSEPFKT